MNYVNLLDPQVKILYGPVQSHFARWMTYRMCLACSSEKTDKGRAGYDHISEREWRAGYDNISERGYCVPSDEGFDKEGASMSCVDSCPCICKVGNWARETCGLDVMNHMIIDLLVLV